MQCNITVARMSNRLKPLYLLFLALLPVFCGLAGCFSARGITEITSHPYPAIYQDDSTARFGTPDDTVLIEVRRAKTPRPLENLAIYYPSLFPGGEIIRPGDSEEYVKLHDKDAYKVVFGTKYIRKRKRLPDKSKEPESVPPGWTAAKMEDPETGQSVGVAQGPVIPRQRVLYLVQGEPYIYYVALRADGDTIESARGKFETFVRDGIKYR